MSSSFWDQSYIGDVHVLLMAGDRSKSEASGNVKEFLRLLLKSDTLLYYFCSRSIS